MYSFETTYNDLLPYPFYPGSITVSTSSWILCQTKPSPVLRSRRSLRYIQIITKSHGPHLVFSSEAMMKTQEEPESSPKYHRLERRPDPVSWDKGHIFSSERVLLVLSVPGTNLHDLGVSVDAQRTFGSCQLYRTSWDEMSDRRPFNLASIVNQRCGWKESVHAYAA